MSAYVQSLNRRLGDALGYRGNHPRFAWCWAPNQSRFVYDTDNRTLLKKSWASMPGPDGKELGRVWVLGEWRESTAFDHHGFADGLRIPFVRKFDYAPYFESAVLDGSEPTGEITRNYIWALDQQLQRSVEFDRNSFDNYMAEEKYTADRNSARHRADWQENAAAGYDANTGAFGNCIPGTAGGFLSFGGV